MGNILLVCERNNSTGLVRIVREGYEWTGYETACERPSNFDEFLIIFHRALICHVSAEGALWFSGFREVMS